jgi:hypothetical protein
LRAVYTIAGRRILIDALDDWSARSISYYFSQSFLQAVVTNRDPSPDAVIRIRSGATPPPLPSRLFNFEVPENGVCFTDGKSLQFDFNGSRVDIGPDAQPRADVWITHDFEVGSSVLSQIISQALCGVLRRCEVYAFHGAGVIPPGHDDALLITGPSGCGKTTLTLQLAACGWNYLADDTLILTRNHELLEAHALRKFFGLRRDTISALQLSQVAAAARPTPYKVRVAPQDLFSSNQIQRARAAGIIFPTITGEPKSKVRRLAGAEAMTKLLRLSPWAGYDKPTAPQYLRFLADLATDYATFELLAGSDLLENRIVVADLCAGCFTR